MQDVVRNGTARAVSNGFRYDYGFAGKTGTTNDYRDSWFAGFSGNYLTVVWVGRDDNQSTGLSGATGAAKVWSKTMQNLSLQRLELGDQQQVAPQKVYYSLPESELVCNASRQLPVLKASLPLKNAVCAERIQQDIDNRKRAEQIESNKQNEPAKKKSFWRRIFGKG